MSLRPVRSPVAPKITMMQGLAGLAPRWLRPKRSLMFRFRTVSVILLFRSLCCRCFYMAAEFLSHRRQDLLRKGVLLTRAEADIERGRQHVRGNGFIDGCVDGPAALPRILHEAGVIGERGILHQRHGGEVEQPRG